MFFSVGDHKHRPQHSSILPDQLALLCGKEVLPHTVCSFCGYYKGREVIDVLGKLDKKEKKQREKEIKAKEAKEEKPKTRNRPLDWKELSKKGK